MRRIIGNNIIKPRVAANHGVGFLLRLIFDELVGLAVKLGRGDERSSQRVGRILRPQMLLHQQVYAAVG